MKRIPTSLHSFAYALLGILIIISPSAIAEAGQERQTSSSREGHLIGAGSGSEAHVLPVMENADGLRNGACIRLEDGLHFTAPCMDLSGTRFGITFNHNGAGLWEADASTVTTYSAAQGNSDCIAFDSLYGFTAPCLDLDGTRFQMDFDYSGQPYSWRPDMDSGVVCGPCGSCFFGVDEAAPFDENPGVHPIVLMSDGEESPWSESLPSGWAAGSMSETELIVCLGEETRKLIQTCDYSICLICDPTAFYHRYGYYVEARIFGARAGDLIDEIKIYGSAPDSCPFSLGSTTTVNGGHVSAEDLEEPLSDYVNGYIVGRFAAPDENIRDLAHDGVYLWAVDYSSATIYKLDPASGRVVHSFYFKPSLLPRALAADGTHLWIGDSKKIYKVNPGSEEILDSFDALSYAGLEHDGSHLWGWDLYGDIYKLDPSTGEVLTSFSAPESSWPYDLAFDGTHLWAADELYDKIYKLDPANGDVLGYFDSPARDPMGLAFDGTHLWISVTWPDDYIYKVNRRSSTTVQPSPSSLVKTNI